MIDRIVAATRLEVNSIGQARDGLIKLGYAGKELESVSAILRTTFILGLLSMKNIIDLNAIPSEESMSIVVKPKKIKRV